MKKKLDKEFSKRKIRAFECGDVDNYICKFCRKVGFLGCPVKYKVTYMSTSFEVTAEETHVHEGVAEHYY